MKGAFLLAVSSGVSRVLGAFARIPLARIVGDEGIGLYHMAYPIYSVMLALSTTGINIAVSKLVAEKVAGGRWRSAMRVFGSALRLLVIAGLVGGVGLAFFARPIAVRLAGDSRATLALLAISPALLPVAVMAALRGLFQGLQDMGPTAVSQVLEQMARVVTMFWLGLTLLPEGIEWAAAGAVFGAVTGALAGLVYLAWRYMAVRPGLRARAGAAVSDAGESGGAVLRQILRVAVPISLASIIMPLTQFIDMAVVPSRLRALGFGVHEATGLYGRLSGMAYPVIFVPTIFTAALAVSLVPAISEAQVSRPDWVRSRSSIALRLNLLVNVPAAVGLAVLAREVCALLYKVPEAGVPLFWLTPGIVFLSVQMISGAVLQGLGRSDLPVKHLVVGGLVKLALTWVLTGLPGLGIAGAAMATVIGYALNAYLNTRSAARLSGGSLGTLRLSVVPAVSSALMGLVVLATKPALARAVGAGMGALAAIAVGVLVYGLLVLMLGGLSGAELEMVPLAGPFLARILRRLRLVRR